MLTLTFNHIKAVDYWNNNQYILVFLHFKYFASVYCSKVQNIKVISVLIVGRIKIEKKTPR